VAYRGRAMVELKTIGGELPEVPVEDIAPENVLKVQVSIAGTECHISLIPKISTFVLFLCAKYAFKNYCYVPFLTFLLCTLSYLSFCIEIHAAKEVQASCCVFQCHHG